MYVLLSTAVSPTWGFPPCPEGCSACGARADAGADADAGAGAGADAAAGAGTGADPGAGVHVGCPFVAKELRTVAIAERSLAWLPGSSESELTTEDRSSSQTHLNKSPFLSICALISLIDALFNKLLDIDSWKEFRSISRRSITVSGVS